MCGFRLASLNLSEPEKTHKRAHKDTHVDPGSMSLRIYLSTFSLSLAPPVSHTLSLSLPAIWFQSLLSLLSPSLSPPAWLFEMLLTEALV